MSMKLKAIMAFLFLAAFLACGLVSTLEARPQFWTSEDATPTPPEAPNVQSDQLPSGYKTATPTPVTAPSVQAVGPTPTPRPGLSPISPTAAALFSVVVPGSGQVYAGDPLKGLAFATLFGLGLWQTIDNLQLVRSSDGTLVSKNEDLGSLFGLATLAVYGFGIQDAYNTATNYNKKNYLTFDFGFAPRPSARLAYNF